MNTTYAFVPITEIHINERTLAVPRGFRVGDVCPRPGGNYRYVIRNRDGASILCRPTPCDDVTPPMSLLRSELHVACDAADNADV